eukprot:203000-Chlamydomonas_euryale.AAC.2
MRPCAHAAMQRSQTHGTHTHTVVRQLAMHVWSAGSELVGAASGMPRAPTVRQARSMPAPAPVVAHAAAPDLALQLGACAVGMLSQGPAVSAPHSIIQGDSQ